MSLSTDPKFLGSISTSSMEHFLRNNHLVICADWVSSLYYNVLYTELIIPLCSQLVNGFPLIVSISLWFRVTSVLKLQEYLIVYKIAGYLTIVIPLEFSRWFKSGQTSNSIVRTIGYLFYWSLKVWLMKSTLCVILPISTEIWQNFRKPNY